MGTPLDEIFDTFYSLIRDTDLAKLSDDDLYEVKTDISIFQHNYTNKNFSDLYSFEFDL